MKFDDERAPRVIKFLEAVAKLCREHGLSLAHEDEHGAFIIEEYRASSEKWLLDAHQHDEVRG